MNIKKFWMALVIILTGLSSVSCGGDDEDGTRNGPVTAADPEGTIVANMANDERKASRLHFDFDAWSYIYMSASNNLCTSNMKIVSVGDVKGLSYITKIPESGWTTTTAAIPGYGYVLRYDLCNPFRYIRVYVVDYMNSTSGGIMGCTIKYQEWKAD